MSIELTERVVKYANVSPAARDRLIATGGPLMATSERMADGAPNESGRKVGHTAFAGVICRDCGPVDITEEQYDEQMSRPDSPWRCPRCTGYAEFDDERFEELMGDSL